MDIRALIDAAPLFRETPEPVRGALARAALVRRYRSGEYVWRAGDSGDNLQVVHDGLVLIGVMGREGEEILLHVAAAGDWMGEPSLYADTRERETDARAMARTTLVLLPGAQVRRVLEDSPDAMRAFVRRVSEMCRAHARRLAAAAFHGARGRLARVLLDLAVNHGVPASGGCRIDVPLSQRGLAGLVGLRRESVNRLLAELERQGGVRVEGGVITVLNPKVLRAAVDVTGWMA